MPLQLRRGTTAERLSIVPLPGEPILDTDLNTIFIGNGTTAGGVSALTGVTSEEAMDIIGQMFLNGQHEGLTFSYGAEQDAAGRIDAKIDLSNYDGEVSASAFRGSLFANDSQLLIDADTGSINVFTANASSVITSLVDANNIIVRDDLTANNIIGDIKGSVFADNSTLLVNAIDSSINLDGTVKGDIIPNSNETYDIGSATNRFKDLYLSGTSLFLGNAQITASGSTIDLPAGSTVDGVLIGSGTGTGSGVVEGNNYKINIVSNDSTMMVNSDTGEFFGNITGFHLGDSKGSLFADDSSILIDGITRNISGRNISALDGDITLTNGDLRLVNSDLVIGADTVRSLDPTVYGQGISVNNNLLLYDNAVVCSSLTNDNLYLGTNNPNFGVQIVEGRIKLISIDGSNPVFFNNGFLIANSHDNPQSHIVNYYRTRGTYVAQTGVLDGDKITEWRIQAHCGTPLGTSGRKQAARITFTVDGTPTTDSVPTRVTFSTASGVGVAPLAALELTPDQVVKVKSLGGLDTETITLESAISTGSIRIYENNIEGENSNEDIVIRPSGTGTVDLELPTQSTVGAAGGASALPATPSIYFKIKVNGTEYVVPGFAVS